MLVQHIETKFDKKRGRGLYSKIFKKNVSNSRVIRKSLIFEKNMDAFNTYRYKASFLESMGGEKNRALIQEFTGFVLRF